MKTAHDNSRNRLLNIVVAPTIQYLNKIRSRQKVLAKSSKKAKTPPPIINISREKTNNSLLTPNPSISKNQKNSRNMTPFTSISSQLCKEESKSLKEKLSNLNLLNKKRKS